MEVPFLTTEQVQFVEAINQGDKITIEGRPELFEADVTVAHGGVHVVSLRKIGMRLGSQ